MWAQSVNSTKLNNKKKLYTKKTFTIESEPFQAEETTILSCNFENLFSPANIFLQTSLPPVLSALVSCFLSGVLADPEKKIQHIVLKWLKVEAKEETPACFRKLESVIRKKHNFKLFIPFNFSFKRMWEKVKFMSKRTAVRQSTTEF